MNPLYPDDESYKLLTKCLKSTEETLSTLHKIKEKRKAMSDNSVFDDEKIRKRMQELEGQPRFQPDKNEMRYTATQLFENGIEATIYFVMRGGDILIYDSTQKRIT